MRIESLEINNYRQYRKVKFDFSNSGSKHDIHIVLGKNGTGKTNMLNAITWCLYGDEMHLGDKNVSIDKLNTEAIEIARANNEERLVLEVTMTIKTDDVSHPKMIISRSVTYNIGEKHIQAQEEKLIVQELNEENNWDTYAVEEDKTSAISRHIPQQINEYIFFDGEQLEKYFQGANRQKLQGGINNLTQVTLIDQAILALDRYDKTEIAPRIKNAGDEVIRNLQERISEYEEALSTHENNLAIVKDEKTRIAQRIEELNEIISNNDQLGEKKERYSLLEQKLEDLNYQRIEKRRALMSFVREQYTLFGMYSSLSNFFRYIKAEEDKGNLPPHIDKSLLQNILVNHKCAICGQDVNGDAYTHIKKLIDELSVSSETSGQLNQALAVLRSHFNEMKKYPHNLKSRQDEIKRLNNEIQACEHNISILLKYLNGIPGQEQILNAIKEKAEAEELKSVADQKIGRISSLIDQVSTTLEELNDKLQEAMRKYDAMTELSEQREYLEKCKAILKSVKEDTIRETRKEMEDETFNIFKSLIWKKDAFSRIEIGEDYTFKLFDKYQNQTLGSCSAAERALLALSFTLALQDVSGHSSLLYIDTPIGRVDTENRENFVKNLLEVYRNKQVILTFTPTEYDMTVSDILKDNTASFVKLKNENGETSIYQD